MVTHRNRVYIARRNFHLLDTSASSSSNNIRVWSCVDDVHPWKDILEKFCTKYEEIGSLALWPEVAYGHNDPC